MVDHNSLILYHYLKNRMDNFRLIMKRKKQHTMLKKLRPLTQKCVLYSINDNAINSSVYIALN